MTENDYKVKYMFMKWANEESQFKGGLFKKLDKNTKNGEMLYGNLPGLYPGTVIYLQIDRTNGYGVVTDYDVPMSQNNIKKFANKGVDLRALKGKFELHKRSKVRWDKVNFLENPYKIYSNFKEADELFKQSGKKEDDPLRLFAIRKEIRQRFREERVRNISFPQYMEMFRKVEMSGAFNTYLNIKYMLSSIVSDDYVLEENGMFTDKEIKEADDYIKNRFTNMNVHPILPEDKIEDFIKRNDDRYSEEQKNAIRSLKKSNITIITGGAGVGKTWTINGIISCFKEHFSKEDICLIAPTGKAARRMKEMTGFNATTIHSALGKPLDSDFIRYNEKTPLPYSLIIVDESSMVGSLLMKDLISAVSDRAKLFLVGDVNQLYPVEIGEPFHLAIKEKLCDVIYLTENYRQNTDFGMGIYKNSQNVLKDMPIVENQGVSIEYIQEDEILSHTNEDIQMISPYNRINEIINDKIIKSHTKSGFFVGEKVIFLKNTKNFSNGDVGEVIGVTDKNITVMLFNKSLSITKKDYDLLAPAYSLTVHKCQGSEYEETIIFLPDKSTPFISKRLIYTALTRARNHVTIYFYKEKEEIYGNIS